MKINEAFKILEISPDSNEKEIKKSYRRLSQQFHPDKNPEDLEKQKQLNEANDVVQAYLKVRHSVVPIEYNQAHVARMEEYLLKSEYKQEISNLSEKIYRRKKNKINTLRYISWALLAISGILTFFSKEVLPTIEIPQTIQSYIKIFLIIFGAASLMLQLLLQRIKLKIEVFTDLISDKRECAIELSEILSFKNVTHFTKADLYRKRYMSHVLPTSIFYLNKYDFIDIILTKSKEHKLITPIDKDLTSIDNFEKYKIEFNPGMFGKQEEEKPKTIEDVQSEMLGSFFSSIVLILGSAALLYFINNNWRFIGILTFLMGIAMVISFFEERKKYRKMKTNR